MKKLLFIAFAAVAAAQSPIATISIAPPGTTSNITGIWANEGGDKVTQDELRATNGTANRTGQVINRAWNGSTITLSGAMNEVVSFNLVLEAATTAATNVSVSFNSLQGPVSWSAPVKTPTPITSIAATGNGVFNWVNRPIELFYMRYLQIQGLSQTGYQSAFDERQVPVRLQRPWTGNGIAVPGTTWLNRPDHDKFYPDIMVPLELVPTFTIAAKTNQSIWSDIYIPKTAAPGIYFGQVTVKENGVVTHTVPVALMVYSFALPDQPSAKTMVAWQVADILYRYVTGYGNYQSWNSPQGLQAVSVSDKLFQLFHRHKISLIGENDCVPPSATSPCASSMPRLNGSLFTAANGYDGPGVNTPADVFSIGPYGTWGWKSGGEAAMWTNADGWVNFMQQNLPNTFYFLYLEDEPPPSDYAQVNTWAQWIQQDPGPGHALPSMATASTLAALENMPYLNIPDTVAGFGVCPFNASPCANTPYNEAASALYRSLPGDKLWAYNGVRPASGSAATEDDGVSMRELGWAQFKKQIDRWFYWLANPVAPLDWFTNAVTWGSVSYDDPILGETGTNGTSTGIGLLVYPGTSVYAGQTSYNVAGPFASLRLKEWRRGIQDADYLTLAAKINPAAVQKIVNSMVPQVLWEYNAPNISWYTGGGVSWSVDPDQWEAARAAIAQIIIAGNPPQ